MVTGMRRLHRGFTLIELLVVMAIISILLSLSVPRYLGGVDKAKEAVLQENLATVRDALDKYFADTGTYPATLDDLVARGYLRKSPRDPITDSTRTWIVVPPNDPQKGGVFDIQSGAPGNTRGGVRYRDL